MLTTKIVHFVKLSKCETDFTIAFLSSRWLKNIYGTSNLESRWRSYARGKMLHCREFRLSRDFRLSKVSTGVGTFGKPKETCSGVRGYPHIRSFIGNFDKGQKFWLSGVLTQVRTSDIPNKKPSSDLAFWIPIQTISKLVGNLKNKS
jgi:hypothetical protein